MAQKRCSRARAATARRDSIGALLRNRLLHSFPRRNDSRGSEAAYRWGDAAWPWRGRVGVVSAQPGHRARAGPRETDRRRVSSAAVTHVDASSRCAALLRNQADICLRKHPERRAAAPENTSSIENPPRADALRSGCLPLMCTLSRTRLFWPPLSTESGPKLRVTHGCFSPPSPARLERPSLGDRPQRGRPSIAQGGAQRNPGAGPGPMRRPLDRLGHRQYNPFRLQQAVKGEHAWHHWTGRPSHDSGPRSQVRYPAP